MEHFYEFLWAILGTIGSGLATWLVIVITNFFNKKIKDKKLANILTSITTLIIKVVQKAYQTTIEALKKEGKFDKEAQQHAKDAAIAEITNQLTVEQKDYIESLGVDIKEWLSLQIESTIYQLKNK